ncbi:MAG: isoprenylcysteine carboxylmethyltransferase family protein [Actinomycetia bacterium]|nr:isoprenylcysteine carboxylmethyltransferase family protein [Actinomycetes bacterium]
MSIELGTSRVASRSAASVETNTEVVHDTATSRLFNATAVAAIVGGCVASLRMEPTTIAARRTSYTTGIGLLLASGILSTKARRHLGRFHRDSLTVHADHEVVDTGPYGTIRHPLYTATIAVFVGLGAVLGNWLSVWVAALPTVALFWRIEIEERMLNEALGESYATYCTGTNRLLPSLAWGR